MHKNPQSTYLSKHRFTSIKNKYKIFIKNSIFMKNLYLYCKKLNCENRLPETHLENRLWSKSARFISICEDGGSAMFQQIKEGKERERKTKRERKETRRSAMKADFSQHEDRFIRQRNTGRSKFFRRAYDRETMLRGSS